MSHALFDEDDDIPAKRTGFLARLLKWAVIIALIASFIYFLPNIRTLLNVPQQSRINTWVDQHLNQKNLTSWWKFVSDPRQIANTAAHWSSQIIPPRREHIADYEIKLDKFDNLTSAEVDWSNITSTVASTTAEVGQQIKQNIPGL